MSTFQSLHTSCQEDYAHAASLLSSLACSDSTPSIQHVKTTTTDYLCLTLEITKTTRLHRPQPAPNRPTNRHHRPHPTVRWPRRAFPPSASTARACRPPAARPSPACRVPVVRLSRACRPPAARSSRDRRATRS